jgi:tetratricopeptide (TPR) repeat protein
MTSRFFIITSCLISLVGASTFNPVYATKLNARPLPTERELKDFENSNVHAPEVSRYSRRMDYRDAERAKAEQEEAARKEAAERAAQATKERAQAGQKVVQKALEENNRGVMFGKQGRWTEAIHAHESACQSEPGNKQYRINLSAARCAYAQDRINHKDLDAAAGLLRKALAAAPDNGMAVKLLNETMKKQGRDPSSADERIVAGDQLAAIGEWEAAMVEYQTALQLENTAKTSTKMGDLALHYGQISTAINWYRQAISKDKDYGPAQRQLGIALLSTRDPKVLTDAASALRAAVILDSKDHLAGQQLVELWRHQVASNPLLAENHLGLAGALQLTGDFNGAESEYNKLQALEPQNPGLGAGRASLVRARQHAMAEKHKLAAETLFNQGLKREALAEISQAAMMEPKNSKYQFLLGECLEANGDLRGAHQAYLTCVLIDPEKNKEAAYRMKEMQRGNVQRTMGGVAPQQMSYPQHVQQVPQQQYAQAPVQHMAPSPVMQKNMFEGGSGMQSNHQMGFRTHDDNAAQPVAQAQAVSQPVSAQAPISPFAALGQTGRVPQHNPMAQAPVQQAAPKAVGVAPQLNIPAEVVARVVELETARNYDGAVAVLREALNSNLQNAEVHHRVAVNLLAGGNITDAIAEFRIASALRPSNKEFAGDLARAMAIHKRSMQNAFGEGGPASGKEVAAK